MTQKPRVVSSYYVSRPVPSPSSFRDDDVRDLHCLTICQLKSEVSTRSICFPLIDPLLDGDG